MELSVKSPLLGAESGVDGTQQRMRRGVQRGGNSVPGADSNDRPRHDVRLYPAPGARVHATELTVAGLAERFMRVHVEAHLKPGSVAAYRSVLEKHVLPALGAMTVGQVGRADISALHHRLRDTPSRANMAVHPLSRMYTLAEAWDLAPAGGNPCRGLRRYRTRPRERFLTAVEYRRLCREVLNQPDRRAALRFLGQALPSLETDVPGLNNEGLAALHELLHCGETKIIANGLGKPPVCSQTKIIQNGL